MHRGDFLGVSLDMLRKVIAAHERFLAFGAYEFLFAGMRSFVARQLVGSGESSLAVLPFADEGLFAGVDSLMSFQMAGLEVVFAAAGVVTFEDATSAFAETRRR